LLWHPTAFGGGQLPREVERVYWKLIDHREAWNDTWTSCIDFVRSVSDRYVKAGLLPIGFASNAPSEQVQPDTTRLSTQVTAAEHIHSAIL
jgi:hypothetical protein